MVPILPSNIINFRTYCTNILTHDFSQKTNNFIILEKMISIINIPGANAFIAPLQDPIAHLIMRAFQRKTATISEISEEEKRATLRDEIENFHDQLKYPFG